MRGPESFLWQTLRERVGNRWHATRHEDLLSQGIPDVSFGTQGVQGWIELKSIPAWPVRSETIVRVDHFTAQQKAFLVLRGAHSDHCWCLLSVGREHIVLFHWSVAMLVGTLNRERTLAISTEFWPYKQFDPDHFVRVVARKPRAS